MELRSSILAAHFVPPTRDVSSARPIPSTGAEPSDQPQARRVREQESTVIARPVLAVSHDEDVQRERSVLPPRVRHALGAYLTQEHQARSDALGALDRMLGIDEYA